MKITRAPRPPRGWFDMQNATARDTSISFRALGVLTHLLSHSDGFTVNADSLASKGDREGRDAIRKAFRELRYARYLVTEKRQNERGRWVTETLVFDTPQPSREGAEQTGKPTTGKPAVGFPAVGKPGVGKLGVKNKEKTKKKNHGEKPTDTTTTEEVKNCGGGVGADTPQELDEDDFLEVIEDLIWPITFDEREEVLEKMLRKTLLNEPAARVIELKDPGALQRILYELTEGLDAIRNPAGWVRAVVRDAADRGEFVGEKSHIYEES